MASVQFYTTNFAGSFSQLSTNAKNSITGVFALKALISSPARVLNLRRSTDSVTADFYTDIQGNLTTSSGQTFTSWIGAATAYVTTWYDQSSAARHATQVTTANQPTFDGTTVNFTTAANQYLDTPASCFTDLSSFTVTCRHTTVGNSGDQGIWGIGNSLSFGSNNLIRPGGGAGYRNYFLGLDFNVGTYAVGNIVTLKYDQSTGTGVSPSNGTRTFYVNQTSAGTNSTTGWTGNGPGGGFIGHGSFAGAMDGGLYYIFMFNTALSDADRSIVENQTAAPPAPSIPMAMTIGPGPSPIPIRFFTTPYYSFSTFTFTPAGATGSSGPTSLSAYGTTYPGYGTPYALTLGTSLKTGMQLWTVPLNGIYRITAAGAGLPTGPTGASYGIQVQSTYRFTRGQIITLLVGQQGTQNSAYGGCGGSYVVDSSNNPIIIAGGAGGAGSNQSSGTAALITTQSNYSDGFPALRNDNGGGGPVLDQTGTYCEAGGGGFNTGTYSSGTPTGGNGQGTVWSSTAGGLSFLNGGTGGPYGGFGGGGGIGVQFAGGGGGEDILAEVAVLQLAAALAEVAVGRTVQQLFIAARL